MAWTTSRVLWSSLWLYLATLTTVTLAADYCNIWLCKEKHVACNKTSEFGPQCPPDAKLVNIMQLKDLILDEFNTLRNKVAGGGLKHLKAAKRMATMQWDDELSYLANFNVKLCTFKRDECRSTQRFTYAGQSIAMFSYLGKLEKYDNKKIIKKILEDWFSEADDTSMKIIDNFPEKKPNPPVGHFTIAVAEKNTHIGCAAMRFFRREYNRFVFVCNFATGNIIGQRIYTSSDKAASGCTNPIGANWNYPNLCFTSELYNIDEA